MTKNEYLRNLELMLKAYNVENYLEIVEKYKKRFDLASDADMTEEEAIKMMGSVESVCKKYAGVEETIYYDVYSLKIDTALAEEIIVKKSEKNGIVINIDDELSDRLNINNSERKINISDRFGKSFFRRARGRIFVEIGPNVKFDSFEIKTVSSDVEICDVNSKKYLISTVSGDFNIEKINADEVRINTVSGDLDILRIKSNNLRISTISGDADVSYIDVINAVFDTISGDIEVTGKILNKRGSSISGNITYNKVE